VKAGFRYPTAKYWSTCLPTHIRRCAKNY